MNTKVYSGFLLAMLVLFAGILFGQSADDIIQKHIEAHGGIDNWNAIQSMKINGLFTSFSEQQPCLEIKARAGRFYSEHHLGQHPVKEGCDGETYWMDDPWFELGFPHIANSTVKYMIEQKAEFCTPFFNYKERGYKVSYEGVEKAEGKDTYKLVLTREEGKIETWFIDTETYLEVMSQSQWSDFAGPVPQDVFYDDFRKVGNVVLPFYVERVFSIRNRMLEIDNIEFNVNPDPAIFEFPKSPEMQKLDFMVGNWDVVLESPGRSGKLQFADSTSSEIHFVKNQNLIEENISFLSYFPVNKINRWSFNSDLGNYLLTSFHGFYSKMEIFQGTFADDSLSVDNSKIRFNDDEQTNFFRISVKDISNNGFVMERLRSTDGGETWAIAQRFTYSRK